MPKLIPRSASSRIILIGVIIGLLYLIAHYFLWSSSSPDEYQQQRVLRFNAEISNLSGKPIEGARFTIFLPLRTTSNQKLESVSGSLRYREEKVGKINRSAEFELGMIAPYGKKIVSITTVVNTAERPNKQALTTRASYLSRAQYIETDDPAIVSRAEQLEGESDRDTLQNIYQWVADHVQFKGHLVADRGARFALETGTGDSSEYMYLIVALARTSGIPARGVAGFVYGQSRMVNAADYHNWAEVYFDGRWHIVDPQNKNLFSKSESYIAFRVIGDGALQGDSNVSSHQLFNVDERLTVRL